MIIYKHTCTINGKPYIGLTVKTITARWYEHWFDAKRKFFAAINKYGKENWTHEILFETDDTKILVNKEVEFIELHDSVKNGYNTSREKFRSGVFHTLESIEKMKISQKERHARKRIEGTEGGWSRKDGGAKKKPN